MRITIKSLQNEIAGLQEALASDRLCVVEALSQRDEARAWLATALDEINSLKAAAVAAVREDIRAEDKSAVFRNAQVRPLTAAVTKAHSDYRTALAAARDLAMRSGKCVRVGN